ncbi:MAG: hypothetical protein WAU01_03130, partial [Saprospiraceae bacterium]
MHPTFVDQNFIFCSPYMTMWLTVLIFYCSVSVIYSQLLPGFKVSGSFDEQQMVIENLTPDARIVINAPTKGFGNRDKVLLILYGLPNGSTFEDIFGRRQKDTGAKSTEIQHIGAQTRFLRRILTHQTVVVAYLESKQKSWPLWKAQTHDYLVQTKNMVENMSQIFQAWKPEIILNGHSGGGRVIFSYLEAQGQIPNNVKRIAFLDSNYGYEDTIHGPKLVKWLKSSKHHFLSTM